MCRLLTFVIHNISMNNMTFKSMMILTYQHPLLPHHPLHPLSRLPHQIGHQGELFVQSQTNNVNSEKSFIRSIASLAKVSPRLSVYLATALCLSEYRVLFDTNISLLVRAIYEGGRLQSRPRRHLCKQLYYLESFM